MNFELWMGRVWTWTKVQVLNLEERTQQRVRQLNHFFIQPVRAEDEKIRAVPSWYQLSPEDLIDEIILAK